MSPKIYDCFLFFNELLLLEVRLNELYDFVDYFVLVESEETFQGDPKALHFEANKSRFKKFLPKIIHVKVGKSPTAAHTWTRQHFQRKAIGRGLTSCEPEDIVIISDLDEIPRNTSVSQLKVSSGQAVEFTMRAYSHFLNRRMRRLHPRYKDLGEDHNGSIAIRYEDFSNAEDVRRLQGKFKGHRGSDKLKFLTDSGWHFSWMGDLIDITYKAASVSGRTDVNDPSKSTKEWQTSMEALRGGKDIEVTTSTLAEFKLEKIDSSYPKYIVENLSLFEDWIFKKT